MEKIQRKQEKKLTNVSIELIKLEWKMPYLNLSDGMKLNLNRIVSSNKRLPIQFRSRELYEFSELPQTTNHIWSVKTVSNLNKPRYVLVGFQTDKDQKKTKDVTKFNSVHMNSVRLHLNSNVYPYHMYDLDISNAKLAELYESYIKIQSSYYNGEEPENQFGISLGEFQHGVLFAFDTSRSDESMQNGTVDIRLEMRAGANIPAKTSAYCLIIYENEFVYSPADGLVTRSV